MAGVYGNLELAGPNQSSDQESTSLQHTEQSSSKACAAPCVTVPQGTRTLIRSRFTSWARLEPRSLRKAFVQMVGSSALLRMRRRTHLRSRLQTKSILLCSLWSHTLTVLKLRRWRNPYLKRLPKDSKTFTTETQRTTETAQRQITQSAIRNPQSSAFIWSLRTSRRKCLWKTTSSA